VFNNLIICYGHMHTQTQQDLPVSFSNTNYCFVGNIGTGTVWPGWVGCSAVPGNKTISTIAVRGDNNGNVVHDIEYIAIGD